MNRAQNQALGDANSQQPRSYIASPLVNVTSSTTTIGGAGVAGIFHGWLVVNAGTGTFSATLFDANTTAAAGLTSATTVGVLNTTSAAGAAAFQAGGDIIFNNGLVCVATGSNAAAFKIIYL